MKKSILLKGIIRDFHLTPLPSLVERYIAIPLHSEKNISLVGC